ncbi:MAG: hypothetical protein JNL84_03935 [Candidatus Accumulibacter sp.]|nr:hypothetical protein [Accumulibacter sp.]
MGNAAYRECAGNYDSRQYLDPLVATQAIGGQVNYFSGGEVVAPDTGNKTFVLADNADYNDRLAFIHPDDIFNPLIRRRDFNTVIRTMLDHFKAQSDAIKAENDAIALRNLIRINAGLPLEVLESPLPLMVIAGSKGTDNLSCPAVDLLHIYDPLPSFCKNWKEMLFLTELPSPGPITIDGAPSSETCSRVLIFSGRKTATQTRLTASDKANKNNYLESPNAASFAVPIAASSAFAGMSQFDVNNPSTDLIRCLL